MRCSYLEIYCEEVRDLLAKDSSKKLAIRDHKDSGVYVEDLASFVVKGADDLDKIMTSGNRHRENGSGALAWATSCSRGLSAGSLTT